MFDNFFSVNGPYARFMNWLWNMLVISVLWLICSIPVVTIGAASTAAYYAVAKSIRHQNGTAAACFFSSFRSNFKQSALLTALWGVILAVLLLECIYLYSDAGVPLAVLYLFYFLAAAAVACGMYLWPCLSRFAKGSFALIQMSAILTFRHLITTIALLLLAAVCLLGIWLMPWGVLVFPGIAVYLQSFLMEPILLRYSPKPSEDDAEANKWYYQ